MDNSNYIYFEINKGIHGLKQAAILAYKQLKTNLSHHDIIQFHIRLECGSTRPGKPSSAYVLMISASNTTTRRMPTIQLMHFSNTTKSQQTGRVKTTAAYTYSGTTPSATWTYQCQDTMTGFFNASSTKNLHGRSMPHTTGENLSLTSSLNTTLLWTHHHVLRLLHRFSYSRLLALCFSTLERWIRPCYQDSTRCPLNRRAPQLPLSPKSPNYLTMSPLTRMR